METDYLTAIGSDDCWGPNGIMTMGVKKMSTVEKERRPRVDTETFLRAYIPANSWEDVCAALGGMAKGAVKNRYKLLVERGANLEPKANGDGKRFSTDQINSLIEKIKSENPTETEKKKK